jgi:MerR family Zn(II)-responsive transcriptional regulator of zntA
MYRIGELAEHSGLSRDTLRFYEREGLLSPAERSPAGYRLYSPEALRRLRFIKEAQALGLSLDEIRKLLEIMREGHPPCLEVRQALKEKLNLVEERIKELERLRESLARRLAWVEAHPDPACDGLDHCVYLEPLTS